MAEYVEKSPEKLGGTPVFRGTRIPVYVFIDYLKEGYSVEEFLGQYDVAPDVVYGFLDEWGEDYAPEQVSA
ncbi:uncharacterized protein (DUF433 family) [Salinibacter ruber]|jgi:uncharacterized protein (DUF433 family)|uniref:DUF433 domain-containing protein n=1 Tax=Salinibacter ruber TaxID=146919 RepID=UPI002167CBFC|nr:DUF433 domain-containing protein [Salinibacter ruber]MCS3635920.1 uncharacterized protein (DUF433 family) [Salinibacter ruber]MCS3651848.1 uncharacterized protein (DUF433 family) [Salinibacter ruber]MCS3658103.1 uncharacterized protein (DUF433 family) [Salinibacter ruber]MCS3715405.1 uncharacterized protein (DUF433 family) [Salinibacter ruber]MCS3824009.1 uncharacterized protein (DUF433 family) [Salinibacter ruber]